jgi:hypothetical protein
MDEATTRVTVDKQVPGYWRVTLNHPPINTVDDLMYDEIFDLVHALATAKQRLNQVLLPDPGQLDMTQAAFSEALRWPHAVELMSRARDRGLGTAGEFELNLGRAVGELY